MRSSKLQKLSSRGRFGLVFWANYFHKNLAKSLSNQLKGFSSLASPHQSSSIAATLSIRRASSTPNAQLLPALRLECLCQDNFQKKQEFKLPNFPSKFLTLLKHAKKSLKLCKSLQHPWRFHTRSWIFQGLHLEAATGCFKTNTSI